MIIGTDVPDQSSLVHVSTHTHTYAVLGSSYNRKPGRSYPSFTLHEPTSLLGIGQDSVRKILDLVQI